MANRKNNNKNNNKNKKNNKNKRKQKRVSVSMTTIIIGIAVTAAIILVLGGALIANVVKSGKENSTSGPAVAGLNDGEVADFEEAGYIKMGDCRGVETEITPTQEEILAELQSEAETKKAKNAMKKNRTVNKGDYVFIDYTGFVNGETKDSLDEEDVALKIGDYEYVEDFENGLIGKTVGKTYTIPVTFDETYDDREVAGKKVEFSITIHGKFDDSYAKWLSKDKYKTVDAYKSYTKEKLKKENLDNIGDLSWSEFTDSCKVKKYPEGLVAEAKKELNAQYENFAKASGTTYEDLLDSLNMDDETVTEAAQDTVRDRMLAKTIAARENLKLDDENYRKYLLRMLEYKEKDNMTLEALVSEYQKDYSRHSRDDMMVELAKDFVGKFADKK